MAKVPSPFVPSYSPDDLPLIGPETPVAAGASQIYPSGGKRVVTDAEGELLDQSVLFVLAGFINPSGQRDTTTNAGFWRTTELIPISFLTVAEIRLLGDPGASSIAYWRKDKSFISGVSASQFGDYITTYSPPEEAAYVMFTAHWPFDDQYLHSAYRYANHKITEAASAPELGDGNLFGLAYLRGYLSSANPPAFVEDINWRTSDEISVKAGDNVAYAVIAANGMRVLSFYADDGSFLSGVNGSGFDSLHADRALVPIGAATMRICVGLLLSAPNTIYYQGSVKLDAPANLEPAAGNLLARYPSFSGFVNNSGGLSGDDVNWQRTSLLPVKSGRYLTYDCVGGAGMNLVSFYDSTGTYVGGVSGAFAEQQRVRGVVQVPTSAVAARFSWGNIDHPGNNLGWGAPWADVNQAFATAFLYSVLYPSFSQSPISASDAITLYGDSRHSTDYPFVAKAWANRFGCTVRAKGLSGHTVEQNASDADLATIFSGPDPRLLVFLPGGNDTGEAGSVGTFSASSPNGLAGESVVSPLPLSTATPSGATFIQNVDLALRKMIAHYGNVRARAGITGGDSEATKIAKLAATTKVEILPVTDFPQQRNNSSDAFSQPPNWERKQQSVLEAASRLKLRCLDFQGAYPIDMSLEPYFIAPTDLTTNSGNLTMDGLHPNEVMAQLVADRAYGVVQ